MLSEKTLQHLPKVELHLHLEGWFRLQRVLNPSLDSDRETDAHLSRLSQISRGWHRFTWLFNNAPSAKNQYDTPQKFALVVRHLLEEKARHSVRYVEVRIGLRQWLRRGFSLDDVLLAASQEETEAQEKAGVRQGLIVALHADWPLREILELVELAAEGVGRGIVGIDLVGKSSCASLKKLSKAFALAKEAGLGTTAHAGEFEGPASVTKRQIIWWAVGYSTEVHEVGALSRLRLNFLRELWNQNQERRSVEPCPPLLNRHKTSSGTRHSIREATAKAAPE